MVSVALALALGRIRSKSVMPAVSADWNRNPEEHDGKTGGPQ
jgi:hypothetical protein